jgi:hypothetical protein
MSYYRRDYDRTTTVFVGIITALALLAIGYLVFSANSTGAPPKPLAPEVYERISEDMYRDKETGCYYWFFTGYTGFQPRLNKFGQPMCGPGQE